MLNRIPKMLCLCSLLCLPINVFALFSGKKNQKPLINLPFFSATQELSQIEQLEKTLNHHKKSFEASQKNLNRLTQVVTTELTQTQASIKKVDESAFDYINKKISILTARKQTLASHQEVWKDIIELIESHIFLLKNKADFFANRQKIKTNPVYSWSDFKTHQAKYTENYVSFEAKLKRRDALAKQVNTEKDAIASYQKQLDIKNKDRERLSQHDATGSSAAERVEDLKKTVDIFDQELNLLREKIDVSKLKLEKFALEEKYYEDELDFSRLKLTQEKEILDQIEKRLLLDFKDVELAKSEWTEETKRALKIKEKFAQEREIKILEKEKVSMDLEFIREKLKTIKEEDLDDPYEATLAQSAAQKLEIQIQRYDREMSLIDAKKDLADTFVKTKEMQHLMIELRYRLRQEEILFDELLSNLKSKREAELIAHKSFKEKRFEAIHSLIENKRLSEEVKAKAETLKDKKDNVYKNKQATLQTITNNYADTRKDLWQITQITQDFLAICSDLITQQENIIKSYNLIINDLEARKTIQSIWKRSPQAISFKAFLTSLAEAEILGKKFFWDTPEHLAPTVILSSIKYLSLNNLFAILLFLLLFIGLFITFRFIVWIIHNKSSELIQRKSSQTRTLYYNILHAIMSFASDHFFSIFTLIFFYLHLITHFSFIFSLIKYYATPYNIALFHLMTIPVLLYLSTALLTELKELNKRLSYLFFTENFQERFLTLLSLLSYSTALVLPLRAAFNVYSAGNPISFPTVLTAAYSLFVLVVILLFFNKEDVLTIIPQSNNFLIWLKRKVEKYYYPVFGFIMGLLILSNHSIGYSNLAWFLAFAIPSSLGLIYILFLIHHYIRQYSIFIFMKEEEDDIRDKFEHAKTYYGFFVIVSFLALLFVTVIALSRIWGLSITPTDLWQLLSETWVIPLDGGNKIGFVQFITLVMFIIGGFLTSSLMHKFVLNKLFDMLRTEPGLQNTISRVSHYLIIGIAIILGMVTIHIEYYIILTVGGMLTVGLGLALKEILTDFVGGFLILLERPIEIGNYVQIDSLRGTVHKISARTTTIVTSKNHSIIVPNRELLSKILINWGRGRFAVGFEIDVRVRHDTDPDLVKRVMLSVAQNNSTVLRVPSSIVRLEAFEENALYFFIRVFISARRVKDQWEVASQIRTELVKAFKENNIKLAWPQQIIDFENGQSTEKNPISIKFKPDDRGDAT